MADDELKGLIELGWFDPIYYRRQIPDPLGLVELVQDLRISRDVAIERYLELLQALRSVWGDEVMQCDHAGLLKLITGDPPTD